MAVNDAPQVVARCAKCGRGFLTLPADGVMVDRFAPPNWRPSPGPRGTLKAPECGGEIKPLNRADDTAS